MRCNCQSIRLNSSSDLKLIIVCVEGRCEMSVCRGWILGCLVVACLQQRATASAQHQLTTDHPPRKSTSPPIYSYISLTTSQRIKTICSRYFNLDFLVGVAISFFYKYSLINFFHIKPKGF